MGPDVTLAVWLVLLGPVAGSFVAAMAERLCAGPSLTVPSRCAACGRRLGWRDMVPILSWLALRGRCRNCGAALSRRLLAAELLGLGAALAALWTGAGWTETLAIALWLWTLIGLALADLTCLRLPDPMTAVLFLAGMVIGALNFGMVTAGLTALAGAVVLWGLARLYAAARGRQGLGFGDVKMMAGIGAAVGPLALPWVTLLAAGVAILVAALRRSAPETPHPFGAALALAAALVLVGGRLSG